MNIHNLTQSVFVTRSVPAPRQASVLFLGGAWLTVQNNSTFFFGKEEVLKKCQALPKPHIKTVDTILGIDAGSSYKAHLTKIPGCERIASLQHM